MSIQNPNWPLIDAAISFTSGPSDPMPAPYWCSVKARTLGQLQTNRGRQYELDQVQTGTWIGSLENNDAALDPSNTTSPFYPQVLPYRAFRHRAQYPATINLLTADQATAGKASGLALGTLPTWVSGFGRTVTTVADSGTFNDYSIVYPASPALVTGMSLTGFTVTQGLPLTAQCQARFSAGAAIQVCLTLQWVNSAGVIFSVNGPTVTLTGSNQQVSVTATVPATAPSAATGAVLFLTNVNSPAGTSTVAVSKFQVEQSSSASAYVQPNPWYPLLTGYVERYPQSWNMNGQFGLANITVVDAFGYLSQRKLLSSAYQELLALNPNFLYPLDEDTGATLFYDLTATRPPMPIQIGLGGTAAMCSAGGPLQVTASAGGFLPQGIGGPVVNFANSQSSTVGAALNLAATATIPGPPQTTAWTRTLAFRLNSTLLPSGSYLWFAADNAFLNAALFVVYSDGSLVAELERSGTIQSFNVAAPGSVASGDWHYVALSVSADGKTVTTYFDGTAPVVTVLGSDTRPLFSSSSTETFGVDLSTTSAFKGFTGDMAMLSELPFVISPAQWTSIYSAFRYGGSGLGTASSASRYQDILRWGSWAGASAIDNFPSGETVAYGPATELNATAADTGTDTVTALQTVVDTDAGFHYVAADGTITFKARRARYNQTTPVVVFGENQGSGEIPYTAIQTGYDNTRVANDISIVQTQTSATQRAVSQTSVNLYGDTQLQRTVNTLDPLEQSDAANYLLLRNSQPVQRIEGISVNMGANPALWGPMLALELGTRVRVMRRPALFVSSIQIDGFVEQINWSFDDRGNASVTLQISVNNSQQYWQLDSSTYSVLGSSTILGY